MLPTKSNTSDKGSLPVSSNSVIWQGPCLDCIGVSTGDTISDVMFTMATELCSIKTQLTLTDLDLSCLYDACALCPDPDKSLQNVLDLLIIKVCELEAESGTVDPVTPAEDSVVIASCFQTLDLNGDPVTTMTQLDYLRAIGIKVCSIFSTVSSHTTSIVNHESRITALEEADNTATLPTVTPVCVLPATAQALEDVLEALEEDFCELRTVTGLPGELSLGIGAQCTNLNSSPALGTSGNMSSIAGWKTTVSTVADSLNNLWLTICDMRTAVAAVKSCCGNTCADVTVNFLANITDNGATINLYFSGYTFLPAGFEDCSELGSKITITDGEGGSHVLYVSLVTESVSAAPVSIDITTTPLNPSGNYTFTLESCVTDGTLTCNKTVVVTATGTALSCATPGIISVALT